MIDLTRCAFSDNIPLDENGCYDDCMSGEFGYRVFFNVPKEEIVTCGLFKKIPEDCVGGEFEFTINADGDLKEYEEILLWITVGDEEEIENDDFINFTEDISVLVNAYKEHCIRRNFAKEITDNLNLTDDMESEIANMIWSMV